MIMATKGQYIAILVIIILGTLIFIAMSMAANNLKTTLDTYYEETNFADFFVSLNTIPESGMRSIENINGVRSVEGRVISTVPFISENIEERVNVMLISSTPDEKINKIYIIDGEYITDKYKDVMVLSQFAAARGIVTGDEITIQVAGRPVKLHVSALVANPEFIYLMESPDALMTDASKYGAVFVSQELAQSLLGMNGNFNELVIDYDESLIPENDNEPIIENVRENIENNVDQYGIIRIYHRKDQLSNVMVSQEIQQLKNMSSSLPMVFLLVAALILTMMLNRMIKKDRGIIGLFKAIC
jgi:putative ABC transport system permease protein